MREASFPGILGKFARRLGGECARRISVPTKLPGTYASGGADLPDVGLAFARARSLSLGKVVRAGPTAYKGVTASAASASEPDGVGPLGLRIYWARFGRCLGGEKALARGGHRLG